MQEFSTRVKELWARIISSQRKTIGVDGVTKVDPTKTNASIANIDSAVLRNFIRGLLPSLRDIVAWKQPKTLEVAFTIG